MKPILCQGHERAITQIKYNREGDLLFTAAKDIKVNVWFSSNGERLGTFNGHQGVVWAIDVDWRTEKLVTAGGDNALIIWDCETGKLCSKTESKSSCRTCLFSYSGNLIAYSTDKALGNPCELFVIDSRSAGSEISSNDHVFKVSFENKPKVSALLWGSLDESLITGHENGVIQQWDLRSTKIINEADHKDGHRGAISDMQYDKLQMFFITASKDNTAKLYDSDSLTSLKTYRTERPVNSAAISPLYNHVVLGGGQEAMDVTTTDTKIGKFDSRFFHLVYEEEFARIKGHFGPINSVAFHPDGRSYSSGGEDGFVRIHYFDNSYFDYSVDF